MNEGQRKQLKNDKRVLERLLLDYYEMGHRDGRHETDDDLISRKEMLSWVDNYEDLSEYYDGKKPDWIPISELKSRINSVPSATPKK